MRASFAYLVEILKRILPHLYRLGESKMAKVEYNGGCYFENAGQYENVSVLAAYYNEGHKGLPAIIKCQVGRGKAILSGAHLQC